jgi:UDP-N-acetylmuramate dehydrogenase
MADLPSPRGKLIPHAPLKDSTWFRVGGHAEWLFKPADEADLAAFLQDCPLEVPVTVLGVASNTLVRDGGIAGVVIRLGPEFGKIQVQDNLVTAGAAAIDLNVARAAQQAGLAGLEFLSGIPGTIGGGLRMNAGAYGREFKDIVQRVISYDRRGQRHELDHAAMGFAYRHTAAATDLIFTSAVLVGTPDDPAAIQARMAAIQQSRSDSQPIREKTGGSTFANPEGHKAWQLIDAAGCRGLTIGGAMMSEKHCNFMINTGTATAADLEQLGEEVRRRVREQSGIELRWEIKRMGYNLADHG